MTPNEPEVLTFTAAAEDRNARLDAFLSEKIADWSRSRLQKLIDDGAVSVNGKTAKSSYKLRDADEIEVELVAPEGASFEPENIALDIVYEDAALAVVNKPAGMVVHPGAGVANKTLANAIAYRFALDEKQRTKNKGRNSDRVGIVHRLDKDTSGLIVVAKTERAHENLSSQFHNRTVYKSYVALVHGATTETAGKIETEIGRDRNNRLRMAVVKNGRTAKTLWRVRERFERFTLLDVEIKTGRTHQIRVHLASVRHPLVGDALYNEGRDKTVYDQQVKNEIAKLNRFFLHAGKLAFEHPETGERLVFTLPLAPELAGFLRFLKGES